MLTRAIAYREGPVWIVQGVDHDIAVHADDPAKIPQILDRALRDEAAIAESRAKPAPSRQAPERFTAMYDAATVEIRSPAHASSVTIRLAS